MKNFEKYEDEILEFAKRGCTFAVDKNNRKITECRSMSCSKCLFNGSNECETKMIIWLYEEEHIQLSQFQYEILTKYSKNFNWIARDMNDNIHLYNTKPKKLDYEWISESGEILYIDKYLDDFAFVKWEDREPWCIKELLKNCKIKE